MNNDWDSPVATDVMRRLSETGTTLHGFFRPELDQRDAKQLLIYVLQSNAARAAEVLKIAKANPRLFFIKVTAQDYAMDLEGNQRTIKDWSPYQALFGTGDKDMLAAVKPDLDAYLDTLKDGRKMAAEQEREKFPDGFDYPPSTEEFNRLVNELAVAITNDLQLRTNWKNPNPETLTLLVQLRQYLKPGIVETGHHFNLNDFIKTHEIYGQNWEPWTGEQLRFFAVNVIGFQERLMTAPHACRHRAWVLIITLIRTFPFLRISLASISVTASFHFGLVFSSGGILSAACAIVSGFCWKTMSSKHSGAFKTYAHAAKTIGFSMRNSLN